MSGFVFDGVWVAGLLYELGVKLELKAGTIEFRNVTFLIPGAVAGSSLIMDNMSFVIEGGLTVAFVGPTGAGKSTILSLIARMFTATSS
ncbi:uncharacterized protein PV07_08758 [Cladophialophora immunda]|uniref:ABC transporter domain-containing protein n=1 Tax=Cladophialophora immunda TaxID=569365 RepID=A0A0D2AKU1_9EURO|nr:uncharacterized protein PV07_08758 [Cladophialophora immunda]KIW25592.1 hypothetical protein PV07_08758 [Cladophialophora immunda]